MEKVSLKVKLYDATRASVMRTADEALGVMKEAQQSAADYGAPKDRYDAYRNQMMARSEMFARQLEQARMELAILQKIDAHKELDRVGFGAVMITENQRLFLSVAGGKIEVDGELYHAISMKVPLVEAVLGRRKGDEFEFRGKQDRILEVF